MDPEPRLAFIDAEDVPWTEVIAQLHGARHGHASDHLVYVVGGELLVGGRPCPPGTLIVLEVGAKFGPLIAGEEGALLFEVWMGDPRPVPDGKEAYHALLKEKGIVRLPNPTFTKPETAPEDPDDGKDLYS